MDRNSIIGLVLIAAIIIGYMFVSTPSAEEQQKIKAQQDSIARVQEAAKNKAAQQPAQVAATAPADSLVPDSLLAAQRKQQFGVFSNATLGKNETITLENDLMKVSVSSKGGRIASVLIKNYKSYDGGELILFNPDSSSHGLHFSTGNRMVITDSMYFTPAGSGFTVSGNDQKQLAMRLATDDPSKYIEYVYTLSGNSYMMGYKINLVGMNGIVQAGQNQMTLQWHMKTPHLEKDIARERNESTVYFKYTNDDVDQLTEHGDEQKALDEASVKWVSFKQKFFSTIIIADKEFLKPTEVGTVALEGSKKYVRGMSANLLIPYNHLPSESFTMNVYFGPNHYKTLKQFDLDLERQISLGWKFFRYVNTGLVIPLFNWLNSFNLNFGLIILILTLVIKAILFPIAYKMYISSAKMRLLKPEIDELNKKYEKDDPMKKQQATMALYKQAGVNPMAGCVPLLLQLPILIALVSFFPSSIELRQESFLWAEDLSTYDSLIKLPFEIPILGAHLSLFAILMTISTIIYTWYNSNLMGTSSTQMPGMKVMMYVMPVMFLGFLNTSSSGLSYYYLLANLISIVQAILMQQFVDEKALHAKIEDNKKKPAQASKWQQRLEAMMKQQQEKQQQQLKKGKDKK